MDIGNATHRERLFRAVDYSYRQLADCRRTRARLIEDYAGDLYPGKSAFRANVRTYVNMMLQTAKAYSVGLAYNAPRCKSTTPIQQLKPFAERVETGLNGLARKIRVEHAIRECVNDAFFLMGIAKVYLADMAQIDAEIDPDMDPGIGFVSRVSFDHWVHDISAPAWHQCAFLGDKYLMRLDDARNSLRFDPREAKKLEPRSFVDRRTDGAEDISNSNAARAEAEVEDMVELCDLYLPRERKIVTFACEERFRINEQKPLSVLDWDGRETGPYEFLEFHRVPDNLLPVSIAGNVRALYSLFNNLLMKMSSRARAQKQATAFAAGSVGDAMRWKEVRDGHVFQVEDPESFKVIEMGGVDSGLFSFTMGVLELGKQYGAGNLDVLNGSGPVAPTASQEASITQNAMRQEAESRRETDSFVSRIFENLADLMWDDPVLVVEGSKQIEGASYQIDCSWMPPDALPRPCKPSDLEIYNEPYSMEFKAPEERLQNMRSLMQEAVSYAPMLEQQGITIDFQKYLRMQSELANEPDYVDLFKFGAIPQEPAFTGEKSSMKSNQPREYIRRSVSGGATGNSAMQMLTQSMAHADSGGGSDG